MKYWDRIEKRMAEDGIPSITHKITIDDKSHRYDFYVKIGWWHGRPVSIDITMSRSADEAGLNDTVDLPKNALAVVSELKTRLADHLRASLELICRQATLLLTSRRCKLSDIVDLWLVTQMEPRGSCKQIADELTGDRVHGPLDAVAKLIRQKSDEWERNMAHEYTIDEVSRMVRECAEALEERPDDFTAWERDFIESMEEKIEHGELSESQIEKLEQIWEDRSCG